MKKILNLSLVLSMMFFASAKAELKIGKKSFTTTQTVGFKTGSFYTLATADLSNPGVDVTAFSFYIPEQIFANGTYDLEYLDLEVNSVDEAVAQCNQEAVSDDSTITLPSNDKVYVIGSTAKIKDKGKFLRGKGFALANKSFGDAKITIAGIGTAETAPLVEEVTITVDETKLPFAKFNYKIFKSDDCETVAQKSKFKVSKKVKKPKFSLNDTGSVTGEINIPNI